MSDMKDANKDAGGETSPREPERGEGRFLFPGGAVYEGEYIVVEGMKRRHGFGKHVDGKEKYVGQWQNDSMHGEGRKGPQRSEVTMRVVTKTLGRTRDDIDIRCRFRYRGYFGDNKSNAYVPVIAVPTLIGEIMFASGASYRGYFGGNKFHGYGRYEWNDAATYEGGWRENKMHGRGCYSDREKSRWEGDFFNGLYDNGRARVALR